MNEHDQMNPGRIGFSMRHRHILAAGAIAALIGATLIIAGGGGVTGQSGAGSLDAVVRELLRSPDMAGATLAVGKIGERPAISAYGFADQDNGLAMTGGERFRIASLSKPVTAAAIAELVFAGRLDLDARLVDLLPEFRQARDPRFGEITIRHLLSHRGGWDREISGDPMFMDLGARVVSVGERDEQPKSCAEIARIVAGRMLDFSPGERSAYSNLGYCLLGLLIEAQTGMPYSQAVRSLVPLTEGFSVSAADVDVVRPDSGEALDRPMQTKANDAAGGWIASAEGYFRFLETSLPDETRLPPQPSGDKPSFYGLGWRVWTGMECPDLTHFGALPGVFSVVVRSRFDEAAVVLFNGRPANYWQAFAMVVDAACAEFRMSR